MKWDLVLNSTNNSLYVADFHLTPISDKTPHTYQVDDYIVKNTHKDNVKLYYTENESIFYSECLDSTFTHEWPLIIKKDEKLNIYSNTYNMGCKRSKRYNDYNKQFEFFCPVWIEHLTNPLAFKIEVKNANNNNNIGTNTLILKPIKDIAFHNKFVNYFNEYITEAGLTTGCDDLLNIKFDENKATVTGLNASTGQFVTYNIDNIVSNLKQIERPLMETDDFLINSFVDNKLISKQLFNFNLCFNIDDLFSTQLVKMMYGENIIVSVTVSTVDENNVYTQLELKDFDTEYDYIPKFVSSNKPLENDILNKLNQNVLSYLHDNEYINFINNNKFCQSICHWSLYDNNDYIFNVYDGFSGLYINNTDYESTNTVWENTHQYKDAPNTQITTYSNQQNSHGWITTYRINSQNELFPYLNNTNTFHYKGTYVGRYNNNPIGYIHNIRYTNIPKDPLYMVGFIVEEDTFIQLCSYDTNVLGFTKTIISNDNGEEIMMFNKKNINDDIEYIILITYKSDNLSYASFLNYLQNITNTEIQILDLLGIVRDWLSSKVNPSLIIFDNSIKYTYVNSPSISSTEVEYYKVTEAKPNYVVRYGGKIKPTFIDIPCTLYYKDYMSEETLKNSIYSKYNLFNFKPIYPSINYCGIKKLSVWDYNKCPSVHISESANPILIYDNNYEYSWFNESRCMILNPDIRFSVIIDRKNDTITIDTIIEEKIGSYYKTTDKDLISYIKSMYACANNWEYAYPNTTDITSYKYDIVLTLKVYM